MYSELAPLSFPTEFHPTDDCYENADQLADLFHDLAKGLSLPTQLREVGIKSDDLKLLGTEAMKQTRLLPNNFRHLTLTDALQLYHAAH
jgi:alcohol dehydrogenase class IV